MKDIEFVINLFLNILYNDHMDLSHIHEKVLNADVSGVSIVTPLRHARRLSKKT